VRREIKGTQNVSRMCLVCGVENQLGLRARFFVLEGGELAGIFRPRPEHQGYPGRLHGGIISAILDEAIGRAINVADTYTWGVTVEFSVRFRKPVPIDEEVRVIARIERDSGRLFEGTGEVVLRDGTVAAEAQGKYLKMPIESIAEAGFAEREWFPDALPVPPALELQGGR
jgi:acyl-coenzyme A thioesterase PaaI-like protein